MPAKKEDSGRRAHRSCSSVWQARGVGKRTAVDILDFYKWLDQRHPELLPKRKGDPYQHLKVDLAGLVKDLTHEVPLLR
jgi:hypothetical protein